MIKLKKKKGRLQLKEIARLDSEPRTPPIFNGQWGIYPFTHSKTIVASDIVNGLMVMQLDKGGAKAEDDARVASSKSSVTSSASAFAAPTVLTAEQLAAKRKARTEYLKSRIR